MSFQPIVQELLRATGASRTTLRLDRPDADFPVVAEALAPGEPSIAAVTTIPQGSAALAQKMARERRLILQENCLEAEPAPPQALLDLYGVRAQMLQPIEHEGQLAGWISVHYTPGPRPWSEEDVAAVEHAAALVRTELASTS